jgi:hypothetical protein
MNQFELTVFATDVHSKGGSVSMTAQSGGAARGVSIRPGIGIAWPQGDTTIAHQFAAAGVHRALDFAGEIEKLQADVRLSDQGRRDDILKAYTKHAAEVAKLRVETDESAERLRQQIQAAIAPPNHSRDDLRGLLLDRERRDVLRTMSPDERLAAISADPETACAVLRAPFGFDQGATDSALGARLTLLRVDPNFASMEQSAAALAEAREALSQISGALTALAERAAPLKREPTAVPAT